MEVQNLMTAEVQHLMTAKELADVLNVSRQHVYELAALGEIPSLRLGRSVRFELNAVLAKVSNRG
jgi:excisionase family DNA binding protein